MASIFDAFRNVPFLGDTIDELSGKRGMDTAAQGARDAQRQANELAQLQWQRQMQGLQEARGQTQPYLSLYDKIYGTQMAGRPNPVGGAGGGLGMPPPGAAGANHPSPYSGTLRPDGTRNPTERPTQVGFGGSPSTTARPVYAPITRGKPTGAYNGQPAPAQAATQSQPIALGPPSAQQANPLEQYLRSLGAMR